MSESETLQRLWMLAVEGKRRQLLEEAQNEHSEVLLRLIARLAESEQFDSPREGLRALLETRMAERMIGTLLRLDASAKNLNRASVALAAVSAFVAIATWWRG